MKLDIEVERDRLIEMELRPEWCQVGGDLLPQRKLVTALEQLEQVREAMKEFVRRVEVGEVRSKKTYAKFKNILKQQEVG